MKCERRATVAAGNYLLATTTRGNKRTHAPQGVLCDCDRSSNSMYPVNYIPAWLSPRS